MLNLNGQQAALVAADNKEVKWAFYVYDKNGVGYSFVSEPLGAVTWATGISWDAGISWDTGENLSSIVLTDFSGIDLRRNMAENTIIAPSEVTFNISNAGNVLAFSNFKGGSVLIELYLSNPSYGERKIAGWKFRIKTAEPGYQNIKIIAEDFLQYYLRGDYPNTRMPQDIFPSNRTYENDALCIPVPFGTAYVPLRDVYVDGAGGYIMLGDMAYTYAISKIRSPHAWGLKSEYSVTAPTSPQYTKIDSNGVWWQVFQAIIADSDNDGVADAPGCWMTPGGPTLDPPVQFTRSDTANMTSPADVIEFVLKDMGVPAANIDAITFAAAKAIFAGYAIPLIFNGAFWYKQPREKVLAQLLTMCHSTLRVGEKIELHILVKASKKDITDAEILRTAEQGEGSFAYQDIVNEDYSDSGYIAWQVSGEAQDEFVKTLVAADAVANVISDEVVECPFVQNSENVIRIGTLHYERKLLKEAEVGFLAKGTCLALQPDDRITINDANYGLINGVGYAVLIDSVKINKDVSIQFQCSKFSITFDDWNDISTSSIVIPTDTVSSSWQPTISGPDSNPSSGGTPNTLPNRIRVGDTANYILIDPTDPFRISVFANDVETARMGNLNGFLDYVTDVFGVAISAPGLIGGWKIQPTLIQSSVNGSARIELDQGNARISVKDALNASKTVMGYLDGLPKHDGGGNWGIADYGFWAAAGDNLKIDGDVVYKSGDWVIENDGSFLVKNAAGQTIIRLGTDTGEKGLFIYDTAGTQLAKFISGKIFIGELTKYLQYTPAVGLILKAPNFQIDDDGTMTAVGGIFKSANSAARVQLDQYGLTIYSGATTGKYGTFKWGTATKYGSGIRFQLGNPARNVPVYFPSSTNYGDIHLSPRTSTPTGAAEADDICCVGGILYICTNPGTPGTWQKVGLQS